MNAKKILYGTGLCAGVGVYFALLYLVGYKVGTLFNEAVIKFSEM